MLAQIADEHAKRDKAQSTRQETLISELSKNQVAATAAATRPKPVQSSFCPKGEMSDYLYYESFIKKMWILYDKCC